VTIWPEVTLKLKCKYFVHFVTALNWISGKGSDDTTDNVGPVLNGKGAADPLLAGNGATAAAAAAAGGDPDAISLAGFEGLDKRKASIYVKNKLQKGARYNVKSSILCNNLLNNNAFIYFH
jgi:hypothetical protein